MKSIKRGLCGLLAALLYTGSAGHVHARFVALGHVDLSFYEVTANVVQLILERLGYNVGVQKGSHGQIYPLLGKGEVDLFVAAWLPNAHAVYWEQYQDSTTKVTALYDDARLFWSVPDYVPASEVKSVADLRKPEVAAKMQKEIRGPGADSGLMIGSKKIVEAYGLGDLGYRLAPGKPADWIASFNDNVAAQRWFVMPLWQPQYLNKAHKMRILEEPRQFLGGADRAYLVAHKDFRGKVDKRTWNVLQRMSLSVKAVTEMDYMVNVEKRSPRDVARAWIGAHPDTVTYWLESESDE